MLSRKSWSSFSEHNLQKTSACSYLVGTIRLNLNVNLGAVGRQNKAMECKCVCVCCGVRFRSSSVLTLCCCLQGVEDVFHIMQTDSYQHALIWGGHVPTTVVHSREQRVRAWVHFTRQLPLANVGPDRFTSSCEQTCVSAAEFERGLV